MKIFPKKISILDKLLTIQNKEQQVIKILQGFIKYCNQEGEVIYYEYKTNTENTFIDLELTIKLGEAKYFRNETKRTYSLEQIQAYINEKL
jgi:hypothetical protein